MTILVTGATGFLGSYLLNALVDSNYKVIALKRSTSNLYRINDYLERVISYNIDEIELFEVFKTHTIDIVINTVTNYGRKDKNITSILETNLMFGLKLLEVSINMNIKTFINTDTLLDRNINSYALSKAQFVDWMKFLSNQNTKMINVKIEHMYGPLDDENKFIYWLINQLKQNVEKIDLTSGIQKRDFIYIDDIVTAYKTILKNLNSFSQFEEYELGTGNSIEIKTVIKKLYTELSNKYHLTTKLNFGAISYRDDENMNMIANIEKLIKLGWEPKVSIEDGIQRIIERTVI